MAQRSVKPPPWKQFGWYVTLGVILYVIVGGIALATVPDQLLANWFPDLSSKERAAFLGPATNAVLFALGGTIALVGVGLSLSRHRQELQAADRDRIRLRDDQERERSRIQEAAIERGTEAERALRDRFVTTVNLLSDPSPVNRQAALFALGALADDWDAFGKPDEVQVCIEVLTGYLRAPRSDDMLLPLSEEEHSQLEASERRDAQRTTPWEVSVKQAGYTVIRNHLKREDAPDWSSRHLNLDDAHIDFEVDLRGGETTESGRLSLQNVKIKGGGFVDLSSFSVRDRARLDLSGVKITNATNERLTGVNLHNATIVDGGWVSFHSAEVGRGTVVFLDGVTVDGEGVLLLQEASIRGLVGVRGVTVHTAGTVDLVYIEVGLSGVVDLQGTRICPGGRISTKHARVIGSGIMDIGGVTIESGGSLVLPDGSERT
ncbi:hypothetical protein ACQ3HE_19340 [Plantibacter auratus]|uniref:hypothetical protein n=1 Tax=Plantibacter auratus TaxID=272914 RepID=UPI003D32BA20